MTNSAKKQKEQELAEDHQARAEYAERMTQMRQGLTVRKDYRQLNLFHKAIILVMFVSVIAFGALLFLSYLPLTKDLVFAILDGVL